jgi:hypothetical protein
MMSEALQTTGNETKTPLKEFDFDQELYSEVSCAAKLQEIKLSASRYLVKFQLFDDIEVLRQMKHRYSGRCEEVFFDENSGSAGGKFNWTAEIKLGRQVSLKLSAEYYLLYSNLAEHDEDHVSFFVTKVGRFATYPYFRALFANHVSESGLMLPPLPTLNERMD